MCFGNDIPMRGEAETDQLLDRAVDAIVEANDTTADIETEQAEETALAEVGAVVSAAGGTVITTLATRRDTVSPTPQQMAIGLTPDLIAVDNEITVILAKYGVQRDTLVSKGVLTNALDTKRFIADAYDFGQANAPEVLGDLSMEQFIAATAEIVAANALAVAANPSLNEQASRVIDTIRRQTPVVYVPPTVSAMNVN